MLTGVHNKHLISGQSCCQRLLPSPRVPTQRRVAGNRTSLRRLACQYASFSPRGRWLLAAKPPALRDRVPLFSGVTHHSLRCAPNFTAAQCARCGNACAALLPAASSLHSSAAAQPESVGLANHASQRFSLIMRWSRHMAGIFTCRVGMYSRGKQVGQLWHCMRHIMPPVRFNLLPAL